MKKTANGLRAPKRSSAMTTAETSKPEVSGGVNVEAERVEVTGDVVGRDKIEVANNFSIPRGVQIAIGVAAAALVVIAIVSITRPVNIPNGNFDNGLTGWHASGGVQVVATGEPAASPVGQKAAEFQIGGILQMTVTINADLPRLTVWYQWPPSSSAHGRLNIYLDDQLQLALDQIAVQAPGWNVAVVSNLSNYAGKSVSLKLEYALAAARSGGGHLTMPAVQQRDVVWVTNVRFVSDADLAKMVVTATPSLASTNTGIIYVQYFSPLGLAIDGRGNIYVVDTGNNRIQKYNSSGAYLAQWGSNGSGNGQFQTPVDIAIDRSGDVYVTDAYNARIQKFNSDGTYLTQWGSEGSGNGQFNFPYRLAIDDGGNVYVTDRGNHRIQKFSSRGGYLTQWGGNGSDNGQFHSPQGIAVDAGGNVYVADAGNDRIQKFSGSGAYLTQWGSLGSSNGQFNSPDGLALDVDGNIYITDGDNDRIQKFNSRGAYLTQWGSLGSSNGQFNGLYDVAIDGSGNVYVIDLHNNRIQKFSSSGDYLAQWIGSR